MRVCGAVVSGCSTLSSSEHPAASTTTRKDETRMDALYMPRNGDRVVRIFCTFIPRNPFPNPSLPEATRGRGTGTGRRAAIPSSPSRAESSIRLGAERLPVAHLRSSPEGCQPKAPVTARDTAHLSSRQTRYPHYPHPQCGQHVRAYTPVHPQFAHFGLSP